MTMMKIHGYMVKENKFFKDPINVCNNCTELTIWLCRRCDTPVCIHMAIINYCGDLNRDKHCYECIKAEKLLGKINE